MENPNYYAIITADVRYNKNLKGDEKLLYGEVTALSNKFGFCIASNKYFAELFGCHYITISKYISNLKKEGLIRVELIYKGKAVEERRIYPLAKSLIPISQMANTPISQIAKDNITSINIKKKKKEDLKKIIDFYENNITLITQYVSEDIEKYLEEDMEVDLVIEAMKEAVSRNSRNWKYVTGILNNCINNKIKTAKEFKISQEEFKSNKNTQQTKNKAKEKIEYEEVEFTEEEYKRKLLES